MSHHTIIIGDSRNLTQWIAPESVQLIVTSPPYFQIKDYKASNQIGYGQTFDEYINALNMVWQQCFTVLEPNCRMAINVGDQYTRSTPDNPYHIIPISAHIILKCIQCGFQYLGDIIWQKRSTKHTSGGATFMGSYLYPRNGIVEYDYEHILLFRKSGENRALPVTDVSRSYMVSQNMDVKTWMQRVKDASKLPEDLWQAWMVGHWQFHGERQTDHCAMFPIELPSRLIRLFSFGAAPKLGFDGDTIFDPFLGSGSTMLAAKKCDRNCIGIECNKRNLKLIQQKVGAPDLFNTFKIITK